MPPSAPNTAQAPLDNDAAIHITSMVTRGPRYTSYPPATEFRPMGPRELEDHLVEATRSTPQTNVYLHIPFCRSLCWYCGCNVKITRDKSRVSAYVDQLCREIAAMGERLENAPRIREIAFGGGSPNVLDTEHFSQLCHSLDHAFSSAARPGLSIELDPRSTDPDLVAFLSKLGCNRISVGVQDFDPDVQRSINRIQSVRQTRALLSTIHQQGIQSNIDLIYGLPGQSSRSLQRTLDHVISMAPHRIALFGYAHLPSRLKHQRLVERRLPVPDIPERVELFLVARKTLLDAGYVPVGLDHFALPDDPLARAHTNRTLIRNFQGYTDSGARSLLGFGASAISETPSAYWQNIVDPKSYCEAVDTGDLPVQRGFFLDADDTRRQSVIMDLMCYGQVDLAQWETQFSMPFEKYFATELQQLNDIPSLVTYDQTTRRITTSTCGMILVRNVAMVFDKYRKPTVDGIRPGSLTV